MTDYALMNQLLYAGKAKETERMTQEGLDVNEILNEGLIAGMSVVGEDFKYNILYVPEVLIAARAMKAGLALLKPLLAEKGEASSAGVLVIGTVKGDLHDIGKNLVKMMFDIAGWKVYDLGRDVPLEDFVEKQLHTQSDVLAMSAMMTTTMLGMKKVIAMVKEKNPDCLIMLGGAPLTRDVANLFGADGYAESAGNAVSEGIKMIGSLRKYQKGEVPE